MLVDYDGTPWPADNPRRYSNFGVDQPYAIFGMDRQDGDKHSRVRLLGSIAYTTEADRFQARSLIQFGKTDSVEIADTVAFIQPGTHGDKHTFSLSSLQGGGGENLKARNVIGIGGQGASIHRAWQLDGLIEGPTLREALRRRATLFGTPQGARLLRRYRDGVLTNEPLWPWPMNQRIIEAMKSAGYASVDVTATVEKLLGPIPKEPGRRKVLPP